MSRSLVAEVATTSEDSKAETTSEQRRINDTKGSKILPKLTMKARQSEQRSPKNRVMLNREK